MTNSLNNGNYSRLSVDPTLGGMVDGVDFPHTGVFKALAIAAQGNFAILNAATNVEEENFSIVQTNSSGNTQFVVGSGMVMRDGKAILVPSNSATTTFTSGTPSTFDAPASTGNGYFLLVAKADNTLGIRDNGNKATLNTVPQLTAGDIPIAMIRLAHGETSDQRQIQYFTTAKSENSVSVGYNASTVYTEVGTLQGAAGGTTLDSTVGDLTLQSADDVIAKLGGTASTNFFAVTDNASSPETQFSVSGAGAVNIPSLTASEIVITDSNKTLISAAVGTYPSLAELIHVKGVSSAIQTQIDSKQPTITGSATTIDTESLTANRAVISNGSQKIAVSATTSTELGYVSGVTSAIQTQLDAKAIRVGDQTLEGTITVDKTITSTTNHTSSAIDIDLDTTAAIASGQTGNNKGITVDVNASGDVNGNGANVAHAGTVVNTGIDISVVGDASEGGTDKNIGLNVAVSDADTLYSALLNGGNVGIGNTAPAAPLHITSAGSGDHLILEGTLGSSTTSSPNLVLYRNGNDTPTDVDDNDLIGQIVFRGVNENDPAQDVNYATIEAGMDDTEDGGEDGHMTFNLIEAGTLTEFMRLRARTRDVVVNDQQDDIDFRIEGDSADNLFFTDASTQRVGINTGTPATSLDVGGNARVVSPSDAGGTALLVDNSDTDEHAIQIVAANVDADVLDITADTVTTANVIDITADGLTSGRAINVVSNSAETNSRRLVNIKNDNTASVGTIPLYIQQDSTGDCIVMESTNDGAGAEPSLVFNRNSASPADGDLLGNMIFKGEDSGGTATIYANIQSRIADTANTAEAGSLYYQLLHQGATKTFMYMTGSTDANGSTTFNYNGVDIDFIVNGENINNLIKVDASTDRVGIGTGSPANRLQVSHTGADGSNGLMIVREDTSTADGDLLGGIGFDSTDGNVPSSVLESSAFIASIATEDHTTTDKGGNLKFGVSIIDEDDDTVSTIVANVGQPDTITASAGAAPTTHAGLNSRVTTVVLGNGTYSPTVGDSGTLVIFEHASSTLALPAINNTTSVGVQFTVFNETGSAINAKITVTDSATINGGAATALDDIASFKAATFVCSGNNTWIRIG